MSRPLAASMASVPLRRAAVLQQTFFKFVRKFASNPPPKDNLEEKRREMMSRGLPKVRPIAGVKKTILVASGKGGVGKSTVAVNLAIGLKKLHPNKQVSLLDADIFGPTVPLMMNLHETPLLTKDNLMQPLINYDVKCMSMGFLIEEGAPVIWRGLMVMQALDKLLRQVDWSPSDFLVIDTPPGTGDTHLSLVQNIPIDGVILVTTPQLAAVQVAERGAAMFRRLQVPLLGYVENMSHVVCTNCRQEVRLFGGGHAATALLPLLQRIPLDAEVSRCMDEGTPPAATAAPKSAVATAYLSLAERVAAACLAA